MKHPHVKITKMTTGTHWVWCYDSPTPPHGGFSAGAIQQNLQGRWSFKPSGTVGTMLDVDDYANLFIVVDDYVMLLNITARLTS